MRLNISKATKDSSLREEHVLVQEKNAEEIMNENSTIVVGFILQGIYQQSDLQALLFTAFLIIYIFILTGNTLVFAATVFNRALHTPMYFFLRHLSFLDICFASVTLPHMLMNLLSEKKTISFLGCAMQMFFFIFLGASVCYLLAVMAYDRYLAICHPLHYIRLMTKRACFLLVAGCWLTGLSISLVQTLLLFSLPFCGSDIINHFFCDILPLMKLHCPSFHIIDVERILTAFLVLATTFILILVSYILIIATILKIPLMGGRQKALGTCSSHILSVLVFYGAVMFMYLRPHSHYSDSMDKLLSLTYTVAPAVLNPIIYSLKNKQVKDTLRNMFIERNCSVGT
ncbi:olfactory receptor 10A2-like [Varanus komodoensis]|nr:olfactory receptor 10A2-like [Varanus komodoensis]